jgi:hypothetical protein
MSYVTHETLRRALEAINHEVELGSSTSPRWDLANGIAAALATLPQPAQEAALPEFALYRWQECTMTPSAIGDWVPYNAAEAWRTEALQQRERADTLERELNTLTLVANSVRNGREEQRERAEKAEAELATLKAEHADALKQARRDALTEAAEMCLSVSTKSGDARRELSALECSWVIEALRDKEGA